MPFTFRDLTLREAEESIVAACLDHEHALIESMRLPWRFFRSEVGADLERVYYVLRVWYAEGKYDPDTARTDLSALLLARDEADTALWVASELYDGHTALVPYCVDLVDALLATYEAQDAAVDAARALYSTPVQLAPVSPPSPARRRAPQKGGGYGGVA